MAWQSTVPAAVAALFAMLQLSQDLTGVDVRDGPAIGDEAAVEVLSVGWQGDAEGHAVTNQPEAEGLAPAPDRERYSIHCCAAVLNGAGNVTAARTRAYEIHAAAGSVILSDQTLRGTVMNAMVGVTTLRQLQAGNGVTATVAFDVDCDAYTGR